MDIKLLPPFDKIIGKKNIQLPIKGQITVKELLEILSLTYPQIKSFIGEMKIEDAIYWRLTLIRNGTMLKYDDKLKDDDVLFIITPIIGG